MNKAEFRQMMTDNNACIEAKEWFDSQAGTLEEIYLRCPQLNYLVWLYTILDLWELYVDVREIAVPRYQKTIYTICTETESKHAWERYINDCMLDWDVVKGALNKYHP